MTPSLKEDSNSTFENSTNSSEINNNYLAIDTQREKLVQGPDGNSILCDSPAPPELPIYAGPDNVSSPSLKEASKRRSPSSARRSTSIERVKPKRVIGNFTLINTLGSGSMGKVRLAVHNISGEKVTYIHSKYIHIYINNLFFCQVACSKNCTTQIKGK